MIAMLAINPLGAYSLRSVPNIYNPSDDDLHASIPIEWASDMPNLTFTDDKESQLLLPWLINECLI